MSSVNCDSTKSSPCLSQNNKEKLCCQSSPITSQSSNQDRKPTKKIDEEVRWTKVHYSKMKLPDLRQLCKDMKVKRSGNKPVLVNNLFTSEYIKFRCEKMIQYEDISDIRERLLKVDREWETSKTR